LQERRVVIPSVAAACTPSAVTQAVLLAAGCGRRLRGVTDLPKGLVRFGKQTLVEASITRLRSRGIARIVLVAGYRSECYRQMASAYGSLIELAYNRDFDSTGTLESLRRAVYAVDNDCLLLESDIAYEGRALDACLASPHANVTVVSGRTGAGDEVWVAADANRRLISMSKHPEALDCRPLGEFVGITKLTREALVMMNDARLDSSASYDTDALVALSRTMPVHCCYLADLQWGEIDDARQVKRMRQLYPRIARNG
jgi:choline kinase